MNHKSHPRGLKNALTGRRRVGAVPYLNTRLVENGYSTNLTILHWKIYIKSVIILVHNNVSVTILMAQPFVIVHRVSNSLQVRGFHKMLGVLQNFWGRKNSPLPTVITLTSVLLLSTSPAPSFPSFPFFFFPPRNMPGFVFVHTCIYYVYK